MITRYIQGMGARVRSRRATWSVKSIWVPGVLSIGLTVVTLLSLGIGGSALREQVTTALVFVVIVVGLYTFVGNSGIVSFGHISFMAIGGYSYALMTVPPERKAALLPKLPGVIQNLDVSTLPATILAGLAALIFAAIIGWPIMRIATLPASIAMFAVLNVVYVVNSQAYDITRGQQSMVGIPVTTTPYVALAWAAATIAVAYLFQNTGFGLRLRCAREDEFAARAIGISMVWERFGALLVSAFLLGLGGALYGALLGSLHPDTFYISLTFTTIVMLVVGGMRSLSGAVVGTVVVFGVREVLRRGEGGFSFGPFEVGARPGLQLLGVAMLALGIVLWRPDGLTRGREIATPKKETFARLKVWRGV